MLQRLVIVFIQASTVIIERVSDSQHRDTVSAADDFIQPSWARSHLALCPVTLASPL